MHCSFCRITGQSRNLPKPNYPPLIPLPQHLDGGASGCFMGVNEKRLQFCKITSEVDYKHHHYLPNSSPSETELWARRGSGSPCRVMGKSRSMELHHFTPSYQDLAVFSHIEGCKITQKNRSLHDYRYVYPCVLLGSRDSERNNVEVEDEVMREMQFSMSYMHHFIEGYEYVCPTFSSTDEREKCLTQLKKKLGVTNRDEKLCAGIKEGQKYVYSVCDDLCSLVVPADIEEILRLGKVDNIWLTADRQEMVIELNRSGTIRKSTITLSLKTEVLTSEELHEDLEGKKLSPGVAGGSHAIRLMEEQKLLKTNRKKKKLRSQSFNNPKLNTEVSDKAKLLTNGSAKKAKINDTDDKLDRKILNILPILKDPSPNMLSSSRLTSASPDYETSASDHSSSNSSSCSSPCGHMGWSTSTLLSPTSPNTTTTRCILIKGPDWDEIKRVAAEEWLEEIKMEEVQHIPEENILSLACKVETSDLPVVNHEKPKLKDIDGNNRTSFESVEEQSTTSGDSTETTTEYEIFVSENERILNDKEEESNSLGNGVTACTKRNSTDINNQQINGKAQIAYENGETFDQMSASKSLIINGVSEASRILHLNCEYVSLIPQLENENSVVNQYDSGNFTPQFALEVKETDHYCDNKIKLSNPSNVNVQFHYSSNVDVKSGKTLDVGSEKLDISLENEIKINGNNDNNICCTSSQDEQLANTNLLASKGGKLNQLTEDFMSTNEISATEDLPCSSIQVVGHSTMNDCLTNVTRSPRVRFRHPEVEEIPNVDSYSNDEEMKPKVKDAKTRICTTPKIGNVPVTVLTSEENDDESDNEVPVVKDINGSAKDFSSTFSKHKDADFSTNSDDDDEVSGIVSKILREHTAGLSKSFRERYRLSSLDDDEDNDLDIPYTKSRSKITARAPSPQLFSHRESSSRLVENGSDDDNTDLSTKYKSLTSRESLVVKESDSSDDEDVDIGKRKSPNSVGGISGIVGIENPVKKMAIQIKMAGYTPPLRLRDLIEQYVLVKDFSPKATDVGSIILREGQVVEVIDSESDKERWLVRTRPSKYLSPRQGWIPISYLEKKSREPSYVSILDDDYEMRSDSKEREAALKRRNVVKELVETEEEFVSDMQHVVHTYLREMDNPRVPKELRDSKDDIFLNFKEICEFHNNVLIKGVQYYAGEPTKLGKTFLRLERDFDMHADYCQHEPQAQELLSTLPVKEYFEEYSKRIGEVDRSLADHLKLPIQRINDYQLLLKELIKYTARLKEDCTDLQKALDLMQGIPQRANDLKLTNNILGFKGNISKLGRLLRHQDWFSITDSSGRTKERYLFLFKSRIFVTKVRKLSEERSSYILKDIIKLPDIEVIDTGSERQFEVHLKGETKTIGNSRYPLILEAQSEEVKEAWFKELGDVKRDIALITDISEEGIIEDITEDRSSEGALDEEAPESVIEIKEEPLEKFEEPIVVDQPQVEELISEKESRKRSIEEEEEIIEELIKIEDETKRPKVEILENFQAYEELNTVMTDSVNSGSASPLDECVSLASSHSEESSLYLTANEYEDGTTRPRFHKFLKGQTCIRGETVTLECEPLAVPPATIAWLKDNIPLKESQKIQFVNKGNFQFLVIKDTRCEDSGVYSCKATNKNGSAFSSAQLNILDPEDIKSNPSTPEPKKPEFTIKFKDTELLEGTSVRFLVKVRSNPDPDLKFFKNDKPLKEDSRIKLLAEDKGTYELSIAHVTANDAGKYTCKAKNNLGESEFSAVVKVTNEKELFHGIKEAPMQNGNVANSDEQPDFKWFRDGVECEASERFKVLFRDEEDTLALVFQHVKPEDAGLYTCVASTTSGRISCSAELSVEGSVHQLLRDPEPPKITAELANVEVSQGTSAMLELKVTGYPKPAITWAKDGDEIKAGSKYKVLHEDDENMALIIKNIESEDAGKYTVKAKNPLGEVASSAEVIVKSPPKFRKALEGAAVMAEQAIRFDVEIEGEPKPEVVWYKDGQVIKENEKIKITESAKTQSYSLEIKKSRSEDAGSYSCVATNSSGKISEFAHVTVNEAPKFLKEMKSLEIREFDSTKFEVKVAGQPEPTVKWFKGDVEIVEDKKHFRFERDDRNYTLIIDKATRNEADKYSCVISNEFGSETGTGKLIVNSAPEYVEKLSNMTVKEDVTDYKLKVKVSGYPSPKIRWFIDGLEIEEKSNRYKIVDEEETKVLIIKKVQSECSGTYSCKISNSNGEASCEGVLNVLTKPKFVEGLVDLEKTEQEDVSLTVKVSGNPTPDIKWYKDKEEVSVSATVKVLKIEDGCSILEMKNLVEQAAGTYECHASNTEGEAVTVSKLIVNKQCETISEILEQTSSETDIETVEEKDQHAAIEEKKELIKTKHKFKKETSNVIEEFSEKCSSIIIQDANKIEMRMKAGISSEEIITIVDDGEPEIQRNITYSVEEINADDNSKDVLNITGDADVFADATLRKKAGRDASDEIAETVVQKEENDVKVPATEENVKCDIKKLVPQMIENDIKESIKQDVKIDEIAETIVQKEENDVKVPATEENVKCDIKKFVPQMIDNDIKESIKQDVKIDEIAEKSEVPQIEKISDQETDSISEATANPRFLGNMESVEVWSGEDAVLECRGISIPYPEIKWYKNGELLEEDKRIKIESDGDKHRVLISNTAVEDTGVFKIELTNKIGKAELEGQLNVKASAEADVPVLLKGLKDIVCVMGDNGFFQAKIYANPEPEIKWFKDGKEITASDRFIIHSNNITHFFDLTVKNVTTDDIGQYSIVADNGNDKISSAASMDVNVPPAIQEIKDKKAMPDSSVSFETKVTGKPVPSVKWVKGEQELKSGDNVKIEYNEASGVHKLTLTKLTPESSGAYACVAQNVAAEIKQPFNLKVTTEAPHFIKGLQNKGCKLNTQLKVDVQVYGLPMPSVKWFKDKQELSDNSKIKLIQLDERNFSLVIDKFDQSDAGNYTCKAINQAGEAISNAEFSLHHGLPEFMKQLPKEVCVMDGEPLVLEAKVDTNPMPEIKWLKDGKEIVPDDHIRIESLPDGTVKLSIDNAVPEDKGKFSLVATNEAGQTASTGQVVVDAMPKAPSFLKNLENQDVLVGSPLKLVAKVTAYPKPTIKWLKDGKPVKLDGRTRLIENNGNLGLEIDDVKPEDEGKYTLQVSNHRGEASSSCDVTAKSATTSPEIVQPLKPVSAIDGTPCRLEAKVSGTPLPACNWFKDGVPVDADDKRIKSVVKPDGTVALLFDKCALGDAGKYTLEAVNPLGSTKCDGDLKIAGKDQPNETKKAPAFILPFRDVELDEGKPLKLTAQIEGNPYPDISWTKDGLPLRMGDNLLMHCDGNKINLEIPKSSPIDSGRYECKLRNPEGETSSKCTANVKKIYSPPVFTQKPTDLFTIPGGDPRFVCRVGGIPRPDVNWYFNDRPLHDSPKYKIRRDGDLCALQIKGASLDDKGRYKCKISNDAGEDHAFANLDIGDSGDRKEKGEEPSFLKKLGDCSIMEGMQAKFTACVAGFPEPQYKWYFNDNELKDTDRIKIQVEPHGLLRLLIKNSKPEDVGNYKLKIWNPHGETESTARLLFDRSVSSAVTNSTAASSLTSSYSSTSSTLQSTSRYSSEVSSSVRVSGSYTSNSKYSNISSNVSRRISSSSNGFASTGIGRKFSVK